MPSSKQKPNLKSQAPNKIQIINMNTWCLVPGFLVLGIFYNWLSFLEHHEDSI
jgi:hypothetical protein